MTDFIIKDDLDELFEKTESYPLRNDNRIVIFSDLHVGDGGSTDDFLTNSQMFLRVVGEYYYDRGYSLILNGDIEELQRFRFRAIRARWSEFYALLGKYEYKNRLIKIIGNHDYALNLLSRAAYPHTGREAIKFAYGDDSIFIIHGHQASSYLNKWHGLNSYLLRYLANPLGITNRGVAHDSRRQYKIERRIYDFSSAKRIMTIIGHTHRPLFESHSKIDELKFRIERHLRSYTGSDKGKQKRIRHEVAVYKQALSNLYVTNSANSIQSSLYNQLVVPSLFNSGCVIGKRGMTGIEIRDGTIRLVHWFDRNTSEKYLERDSEDVYHLRKTPYYRKTLKADSLDYIFARINLLA